MFDIRHQLHLRAASEIHKWNKIRTHFYRLCFTSIFWLVASHPTALYNFGFLHHKSFRIFWSRCSITNLSNTFVTVHTNVQWRNTRMLAYLKKSDKYLLIPLLRVNSMWIVNWLIERNLGQHLLALKIRKQSTHLPKAKILHLLKLKLIF
jgi:hypothetical protein